MSVTSKLYCNTCHTCWTEACLSAWRPCPFKDCGGTLSHEPPRGVAPKPRPPKEPSSYPLLDVIKSEATR